jgi:hypothetical protein
MIQPADPAAFDFLLPRHVDNTYGGHKPALWLLGLVLLMKSAIGLNSIFNGYTVARSADGVPLETFSPEAARAVVSLFSLLGVSHVVFALIGILVLFRYRALVPLVFSLLLLEHVGKRLVLYFQPVVEAPARSATVVGWIFLVSMAAGLVLSLWKKRGSGL